MSMLNTGAILTPPKKSERTETVCLWAMLALWASLSFSSALVEMTFAVAIVSWLTFKIKNRSLFQTPLPLSIWLPLLIYVLLNALSLSWTENVELSVRGFLKVLQQVMTFWIAADLFQTAESQSRFRGLFYGVFAVLIANGCFQYVRGVDFIRGFSYELASSGPRITASFKSYGLLASFLIMTLPVIFSSSFIKEGTSNRYSILKKAAKVLLLFGGVVLLFWTRSRGAFLAAGTGVVLFLLWQKNWKLLGVLFAAGFLAVFLLPQSMIIHLDGEGKEQSIVERYYLWERAWNVIQAEPLTGTGVNTYSTSHQKYDLTENWRVRDYYAHNGYLQMAAEIGLPGLAAFLVFLLMYFKESLQGLWKSENAPAYLSWGLLVGVVNFLVLACVDTVLHNAIPVMTFWYLLGLQWGMGSEPGLK